jgi:cell division protein FtsW
MLQVGLLVGIVSGLAAIMPFVFPHVMRRIEAFLADPFLIDPQGANYQITQALIAYGRGGFDGVGLGGSVQKMFYLPEAHTDFLFAVIAEEFGFIGTGLVILAFAYVVWKAFSIGQRALACGQGYAAHLAHGLGIWVGVQAFINIGVNTHLLPNTGMTLPLMSYGGTSLLLSAVVIALLLRIEHELCPAQRRIVRVSTQGERTRGGESS